MNGFLKLERLEIKTKGHRLFFFFFSVRLLSVLRCHSVFSSPPQRPMTSYFEDTFLTQWTFEVLFWLTHFIFSSMQAPEPDVTSLTCHQSCHLQISTRGSTLQEQHFVHWGWLTGTGKKVKPVWEKKISYTQCTVIPKALVSCK